MDAYVDWVSRIIGFGFITCVGLVALAGFLLVIGAIIGGVMELINEVRADADRREGR